MTGARIANVLLWALALACLGMVIQNAMREGIGHERPWGGGLFHREARL